MRSRNTPGGRRRRQPAGPSWHSLDRSRPHLLPTSLEYDHILDLKVRPAQNPLPQATIGDSGIALRVDGQDEFEESILVHPVDRSQFVGLDTETVRFFRVDAGKKEFRPVWNSGLNLPLGFAWARVRNAGLFVAIGLPRDRLLQEAIRRMGYERRFRGDTEADAVQRSLLALPPDLIQELREYLARTELQTTVDTTAIYDAEIGTGGHPVGFKLPGGASLKDLIDRMERLEVPPGGLPEEHLFYPPEIPRNGEPPWNISPDAGPWKGVDWRTLPGSIFGRKRPDFLDFHLPPWLFSQDWWMHGHDERHTDVASGLSDINMGTVHKLYLHKTVAVDGPVVSKPSIVDGKVYIGSGKQGGTGGTFYKIDLYTGTIEHAFATSGSAFYSWVSGIGGSPAIVGDRVYFTGVHGTVYCLDRNTFALIWSVSLKTADASKNQPVTNPNADSWSGPLVVKDKVYVGCGEGESATTYGFVFCLDAATGNVLWCFCTCKFGAGNNAPNNIPTAVAAPWAAAHGFTVKPNPPETGCSVWSSCAYDVVNNCIYVGTGNSQYPHTEQPDELYGSGLISLDADTGAFKGFFQPAATDSYWPADYDIDVPGAPSVYTIAGNKRVVAFGSKNGSFFVLDAANISNVIARRQLLPRVGGTGLPGSPGTSITDVVPNGVENKYGVFGTPAIHFSKKRLFVGLGGYDGMHLDAGAGIDQTRTPFMRALDWQTLADAWPTAVGADNIIRYTNTKPPMYSSREVGLSSPAIVDDVVFITTSSGTKAQLYALSVDDGHCLWTAGGLPTGQFTLGPSIYGNYVVVGSGEAVYIYRLGPRWKFPPWPILWRKPWPWEIVEGITEEVPIGPWPGPDPGPLRKG
jgi:outer membrane protein assembly factor BamB